MQIKKVKKKKKKKKKNAHISTSHQQQHNDDQQQQQNQVVTTTTNPANGLSLWVENQKMLATDLTIYIVLHLCLHLLWCLKVKVKIIHQIMRYVSRKHDF
jgi:hypothetical protein